MSRFRSRACPQSSECSTARQAASALRFAMSPTSARRSSIPAISSRLATRVFTKQSLIEYNAGMKRLLALFAVALFAAPIARGGALENDVLRELNRLRTDPRSFLPHLRGLRARFEGTSIRLSPQLSLQTQEGPPAIDDAIAYLQKARRVGKLKESPLLAKASADLQREQEKTGGVGHEGKSGSTPASRLAKYATVQGKHGQNIAYGSAGGYAGPTGIDMVTGLFVDDGVSDRGHRKNMMDPEFKLVGIACGKHPKYGRMCAMDLASAITAK